MGQIKGPNPLFSGIIAEGGIPTRQPLGAVFKMKQVFSVAVSQCPIKRETNSDVIGGGAKGEDR